VSRTVGRFDYGINELLRFDPATVNLPLVKEMFEDLLPVSQQIATKHPWASERAVKAAMRLYGNRENIPGEQSIARVPQNNAKQIVLTKEFVEIVASAVPPQPWKPGVHRRMAEELNCSVGEFFAAVEQLIVEGRLLRQRDGVLFDQAGNVVGFDPERVDDVTLQLKVSRH
jgi:hypothetical protein